MATIGVAFLSALTSVGALFYFIIERGITIEEKIVIQSKNKNAGLIGSIIWVVGIIIGAILFITETSSWKSHVEYVYWGETSEAVREMSLFQFMFTEQANSGTMWYLLIPIAVAVILGFVVYFAMHKIELTVTDKRVYGIASFGKRVELPLDSISAVGTGLFNSITIATSSGKIAFVGVQNRNEVHKALSGLLIGRQNKSAAAPTTTIKQEIPQSNAEELKKYKELLDMGVISQEEFEAKKKQLLGL